MVEHFSAPREQSQALAMDYNPSDRSEKSHAAGKDSASKAGATDTKIDTIDTRVENRMKRGDFVEPLGEAASAKTHAKDLTNRLIQQDMFKNYHPEDPRNLHERAKSRQGDYPEQSREASKDIDKKEQDIARTMWNSLDPKTKEAIMNEQFGQIYMPRNMQHTPLLDKFRTDLADNIKPLEDEREHINKSIWSHLSESQRRAILKDDERQIQQSHPVNPGGLFKNSPN